MSGQNIHVISDTESESESDGGMQLDDLDRVDGIPMYDNSEFPNVDGRPMPRPLSEEEEDDDDVWGVNTSNGSDTGMYPSSLVVKSNYEPSLSCSNLGNPCFCAQMTPSTKKPPV